MTGAIVRYKELTFSGAGLYKRPVTVPLRKLGRVWGW